MHITERIKDWTVLLVDDEPDNLGIPQQLLEFYGARVYTACDGQQALASLQTIHPTFIITDLSMPQMDGWELLQAVRNNPLWVSLPMIALTAHAMRGDREKALAAGFDQYITKPFRLHTFLSELESCLDRMPAIVV